LSAVQIEPEGNKIPRASRQLTRNLAAAKLVKPLGNPPANGIKFFAAAKTIVWKLFCCFETGLHSKRCFHV
jgi:hypothetical protein